MSKHNPLQELGRFGVSVWYDNISRGLLRSGTLARLIESDGVRGVTSNPTIFEKAIGGSSDYDEQIRALARAGHGAQEVFEGLAVEDIRAAADLFKPLYDSTRGRDGYVSLEVSPALARDAAGTRAEAIRLFGLVGRPNVMIKIPGTAEGLGAVEGAIAEGVPVNVTLLFAQRRYAEVVEAYLKGLERRLAHGKDLSKLASVASYFVSRVDSAVDGALEALGTPQARALLGKAAIANAKLAYQIFKREFGSPRWDALRKAGAQPQRLLWASTGTKNAAYRDVLYVEELVGAETVNTMPPATVDAFRDHGACRPSLDDRVEEAREQWDAIGALGIDLDAAAARLEAEGLAAFAKSFETLLGQIAAKREMIQAEAGVVEAGLAELERCLFVSRLWSKDASLWSADKDHQKIIKNSLGWLTAPEAMAAGLGTIRSFVTEARAAGMTDAVVLGMGGSSLACEVFRSVFPTAPGYLRLHVLDSTNPAALHSLRRSLDLKRTLFIVSSKSGGTIEPNCMLAYFWAEAEKALGAAPGAQFAAITDPGTSLEKLARQRGFRKVFLNAPDIGGRYSALTYFGLVPAALMGVEVEKLLARARQAARSLAPAAAGPDSPALRLGAAMGKHAAAGRDKLTLCLPPALESLGLWIEQLVAESSGKAGRGIVPVCGEAPAAPSAYGPDRFFVRLELDAQPDGGAGEALSALERAGHPVMTLRLPDVYELGAQFFAWEVATAAACQLLGVDPFDQPDVQSAKDQTKALLGGLEKGQLPAEPPSLRAGGMAAYADAALEQALAGAHKPAERTLCETLAAHFKRVGPGDYVALLAYCEPSADNARALEALRRELRRLSPAPVCVEFGPRYLHSTGQLYKGGGANALFLQLVESDATELPVPGEPYSFGTLFRAQARGDFAATAGRGRRVLRLELGLPGSQPLQAVVNAAAALSEDRCRS